MSTGNRSLESLGDQRRLRTPPPADWGLLAFGDTPKPPGTPDSTDRPATPLEPLKFEKASTPGALPTATIDYSQFGYKLKLISPDGKADNLQEIRTEFNDGKKPTQVYKKDGQGWYQELADGKQIRMQGDLRVNPSTHEFTQVLRRDFDGEGNKAVKETTRTMSLSGTETIHRMDGSESIFEHSPKGEPTKWIERDKDGKAETFMPKTIDGKAAWVSEDGKKTRYNRTVEDNGNVTWTDSPSDPSKRHVQTSAGDHMVDGDGAKYTFNDRGDVTSMSFVDKDGKPRKRWFEEHYVDRVDIAYRGDTRIIDGLTLMADGRKMSTLERTRTPGSKEDVAENTWRQALRVEWTKAANGSLTNPHWGQPRSMTGDYAIQDGQISTTENNPLVKRPDGSTHRLTTVDGAEPERVRLTYLNDKFGANGDWKPEVKYQGFTPADYDIPVAGEAGYQGLPNPETRQIVSPQQRRIPEPPTGPRTVTWSEPSDEEILARELERNIYT